MKNDASQTFVQKQELQPHRWAEVIKSYADGYPIQYRVIDKEDQYVGPWMDSMKSSRMDSPNFNLPDCEWRVKPTSKSIKFRVALLLDRSTNYYYTFSFGSSEDFDDHQSHGCPQEFVRWLTDWTDCEL